MPCSFWFPCLHYVYSEADGVHRQRRDDGGGGCVVFSDEALPVEGVA